MNSRFLARGVATLLCACSLQGCCFRSCTPAADAAADGATAAAVPPIPIGIAAWGPQRTRAGVAFNVQPGGQAAIWIRLDRKLDGTIALVRFGDAYLEGQVAGETVTAVVPPEAYAARGLRDVGVVARSGSAQWRSDTVPFTVE
jgi:hypothetical protein